ncbi:MAG: hypothetical protein JNM52_05185 [Betaproteobacteria bacterium]|nr:hypothetical protein [Betaproteobacteria bacterium]
MRQTINTIIHQPALSPCPSPRLGRGAGGEGQPARRASLFFQQLTIVFAIMFLIAGCSTVNALNPFKSSGPQKAKVETIKIISDINLNNNMATALDLVFVYDVPNLQLPKTGPEWFQEKEKRKYGLADAFDVVSLQIPPPDLVTVQTVELPRRYRDAVKVLCYANYIDAAGQPMLNLTPYPRVSLRLTRTKIIVTPLP